MPLIESVRRFRAIGLAIAVVSWTLLRSAILGAQPYVVAPRPFVEAALKASVRFPQTHQKIEASRDQYFVIFIPGILGSEIDTNDGEPLWGSSSSVSPQLLALRSSSPLTQVKVLSAYPTGLTNIDVYGEFETDVRALAGGHVTFREFAYDWRRDIADNAKSLDEKLRLDWHNQLKGKKLIVVAHSMGGLVAWTWKNLYYRNNTYDFEWYRLALLGTPLRGSCEPLRMLLTGYRPYPGASQLEEQEYRLLFSQLRAAAFTFPSMFELLPAEADLSSNSCLQVRTNSGTYAQDHFSPEVWGQS